MTTFFSADHHFGHTNIIRYCARPFRSAVDMDDSMVGSWNATVKPTDTVYYLGDLTFRPWAEARDYLDRLNGGSVFLIPGNHDKKWWRGVSSLAPYGKLKIMTGFRYPPVQLVDLTVNDHSLWLHHYPPEYWSTDEISAVLRDDGIVLHGHSHGTRSRGSLYKGIRCLDIGVDCWEYTPVSLETVAQELFPWTRNGKR